MATEEAGMEARIARLESDVEHIRSDMVDLKVDVRALRDKIDGMNAGLTDRIDGVRADLSGKIDAGHAESVGVCRKTRSGPDIDDAGDPAQILKEPFAQRVPRGRVAVASSGQGEMPDRNYFMKPLAVKLAAKLSSAREARFC